MSQGPRILFLQKKRSVATDTNIKKIILKYIFIIKLFFRNM